MKPPSQVAFCFPKRKRRQTEEDVPSIGKPDQDSSPLLRRTTSKGSGLGGWSPPRLVVSEERNSTRPLLPNTSPPNRRLMVHQARVRVHRLEGEGEALDRTAERRKKEKKGRGGKRRSDSRHPTVLASKVGL